MIIGRSAGLNHARGPAAARRRTSGLRIRSITFTPQPRPRPCPADADGDGFLGLDELLGLLGGWGACPPDPAD